MAKKEKDQKNKKSFGRRLFPLAMGAVLAVTPFMLAGCSNGQDGKNGVDGTKWYSGLDYSEVADIAKTGDYFIEKDTHILWQLGADGEWDIVMENFGKPGNQGNPGQSATQYYTYVRYATDANGTGFSADPTGCKYISVLTTTKTSDEIQASDFTVWVKFVGENGNKGDTGVGSYTYIAFASDNQGTGFSTTHTEGLDYIGILTTNTEITNLTAENFTGKWIKFVGEKGEDGLTPYIGYDGYFWYGDQRSEHKFIDVMTASTAENTIGLAGNQYIENYAITAGTPVAMMNRYFSEIKKTAYSGTSITSIQVYAETAGTLTISTASVADIVARDGSTAITLNNSIQKELVAGLNTITFDTPFAIPSTETLVLGKTGDTATLVAYQGIEYDEITQGAFADLSVAATDSPYKETNEINDKLVVKIECAVENEIVQLTPGMESLMNSVNSPMSISGKTATTDAFFFANNTLFSGNRITSIKAKISSINGETNPYLTVFVADKATGTTKTPYKFYLEQEDVSNFSANGIYTLTPKDDSGNPVDVIVGEDQTLAFYDYRDKISPVYENGHSTAVEIYGGFYANTLIGSAFANTKALLFDVYGVSTDASLSFSDNIEKLEQEVKDYYDALEVAPYSGKYVSVLGDSISTYQGYTNVNTYNTNVSGAVHYSGTNDGITSVDDTYWMSVINALDMEFCVNSAVSGDTVLSGYNRVTYLADNTTSDNPNNEIVNPDYIIINFGINDIRKSTCGTIDGIRSDLITDNSNGTYTYLTPNNFAEAYEIMLHKAKALYGDDVKIVCATLPYHTYDSSSGSTGQNGTNIELVNQFNTVIKTLANKYGAKIADVFAATTIDNGDGTYTYTYSSNYTNDLIHPNANGMELLAELYEAAFREFEEVAE